MAVTSIEKFKQSAIREVEIPGFIEGETFTVEIKPVSLLTLLASGKLPNELMSKAQSLFFEGNIKQPTEEEALEMAKEFKMDDIVTMAQLMDTICEAVLYNPKFSEIGEYMTQEQKEAIFEYSQAGVKAVTPNNTK